MRKTMYLILLGLSLALAACSTVPVKSGPQEVTLEVAEFKYQPATVQVEVGRPVKVTMRNMGTIEHDWSIMEIPATAIKSSAQSPMGHDMGGGNQPELHMVVAMGQMAQMEFTPTRPGTFQFYCTVAGHKEAGMVGTLVVK
ncbi:MAG: cupredoxin domain-containing protein [Chloroflexi bacterium]|nr:cupredoxin domain-containing protein [Chloroflexota bacterium]